MSDKDTTAATAKSAFTDREMQLLGLAMQCLKSGPPDIDYDKLADKAGMANPKSAANAWAKIRTKLAEGGEIVATTPRKGRKSAASKKAADDEAADTKADAGDDAGAAPQTPKKARAKRAPKKKEPAADTDDADAKADGSDDNAMLDTPKKTSRKRTPKKQEVDGEESPKKKPRANQTKKVSPKSVKTEEPVETTEKADDSNDADAESDALNPPKVDEDAVMASADADTDLI